MVSRFARRGLSAQRRAEAALVRLLGADQAAVALAEMDRLSEARRVRSQNRTGPGPITSEAGVTAPRTAPGQER